MPDVSQFAKETKDRLKIVGLGSTDSLNFAKDFYEKTNPENIILLWDENGKSWRELGVYAHPSWMLLDKNGEIISDWRAGGIDQNKVESLIN